MIRFAAWGQDKNRMGLPKARCPKKASALSLWKKNRSLLLLLSVQTPRGACCCRANVSRLGGRASLEAIPIGRDKTKSRWFSKSKSVCAGGSGKVPRLCAIQTPQCGGMKGKLCFIKRKSKNLVSNGRIFCGKNVSFFEHRERPNENLWTFLRNFPHFLFFLPIFGGNDARSFLLLLFAVSSSAASYARTDTPLRIAHSASSQFLPSPFTFTCNLLIHRVLRVKDYAFFCLHW